MIWVAVERVAIALAFVLSVGTLILVWHALDSARFNGWCGFCG